MAGIPSTFGIKSGSWGVSPLEVGIKKNILFHILKVTFLESRAAAGGAKQLVALAPE
jgi:hypothetical protein